MTILLAEQGGIDWIGLCALALAVPATLWAWYAHRKSTRKEAGHVFKGARALIRARRADLTQDALAFHAERHGLHAEAGLPLLAGDGWIPQAPIPLADVDLVSDNAAQDYADTLAAARHLLPYDDDDVQHKTYASAVQAMLVAEAQASGQKPPLFENRQSYRLVDVKKDPLRLHIARGMYFDHQNTDEVVGYETALAAWRREHHPLLSRLERRHRLRTALGNPLDLSRRCVIPGVSTLTIRKADGDSRFFMHNRIRVALAQGTHHVTPAGEFQPSGSGANLFNQDRDLWKNIQREYHEEFLGAPESWHTGHSPDYRNEEPYKLFNEVYEQGDLKVWFLGIGLDPLTLKAEILTCAVWEGEAFDLLFGTIVDTNEEGILFIGDDRKGMHLTRANLDAYRLGPQTLAAGRACIDLLLRHRETIGVEIAA